MWQVCDLRQAFSSRFPFLGSHERAVVAVQVGLRCYEELVGPSRQNSLPSILERPQTGPSP